MDTVTHALSGALLARATWRNQNTLSLRQRTLVGFLTAAFPDIDYILRLTTDFIVYLNYHRGITHSVLMLPLWALLLALIFSRLLKPAPDWRALYLICCLGLGIHIAGDVITSYGTMIFAPFSDWRASLDTTFIIDPVFSGIILIALICSYAFKNKQLIALSGIITLTAYIFLQALAHQRALLVGRDASLQYGWGETTVNAIPQPLSPAHWKIIVEHKEHYHVSLVRLLGTNDPLSSTDGFFGQLYSAYHPPASASWSRKDRYGHDRFDARTIKQAWYSDSISDFRRFARYPFLVSDKALDNSCYWFADLRFIIPGRQNTRLFTYSVCPGRSSSTPSP